MIGPGSDKNLHSISSDKLNWKHCSKNKKVFYIPEKYVIVFEISAQSCAAIRAEHVGLQKIFIPSIVIAVLSQNLILGEIYRKSYRKSICRPFSNYWSNYPYRFYTFWSYRWFWGIIGNIIDIESLREIIEKLSLSKNLTYRPLLLSGGRDFHDSTIG